MRIVFQKRRYYQGAFRNIGDVVEVSDRFARAFLRVGAAAPAPGKPESSVKSEEPKFIRRNLKVNSVIPEQPALVTELEETEDSLEELPDPEAVEESKTEIPLDSLPYAQLRQLCKELDLPVNGKKEELLRRLSERGR